MKTKKKPVKKKALAAAETKQPKLFYEVVTDRMTGETGTIRIMGVHWHRNGIGGEGFKVVHFSNEDGRNLIGIVTDAHDEDGEIDREETRRKIKVINPMDIEDCYRGSDAYGEILLQVHEDRGFDKY